MLRITEDNHRRNGFSSTTEAVNTLLLLLLLPRTRSLSRTTDGSGVTCSCCLRAWLRSRGGCEGLFHSLKRYRACQQTCLSLPYPGGVNSLRGSTNPPPATRRQPLILTSLARRLISDSYPRLPFWPVLFSPFCTPLTGSQNGVLPISSSPYCLKKIPLGHTNGSHLEPW